MLNIIDLFCIIISICCFSIGIRIIVIIIINILNRDFELVFVIYILLNIAMIYGGIIMLKEFSFFN